MLATAACGSQVAKVNPMQTPAANVQVSPIPIPTPGVALPPTHVFVIVIENRSYSEAMAGGYTAKLAHQYAYATNYHGVSHPSLPNYLAMTSGSTWGITDDGFHALPAGGLGAQLTDAGVSWRAYMEGMNNGCFHSGYPYALKHNPFAYYGSSCPSDVVPFTDFAHDMAQPDVPRFVWITPGLCNDGHDCSTAVADAYLSHTVPQILATTAWQQGGVLFITWDEGEDAANSVLTLVIQPNQKPRASDVAYNHYSLLAATEDRPGVGPLGKAAGASPMSDLLA